MERQKLKRNIQNYISEIEHAIYHPILNRDTAQIKIDKVKAFFLLLPLLNGERWTEEMKTSAIAVGTVHVAFDAHDTIDIFDATSKQQQLTVLAGDFYSGIHYKLLASLPDFSFIQKLSSMIGRINEVKTETYGFAPTNATQLIEAVQIIESGCIIEFLHEFGFARYAPLAEIALPLLRMDADMACEKTSTTKQSIHIDLDWNEDVLVVEQVINELRIKMSEAIAEANFIAPFLKEEICGMTIPLLGKPI